MKVVYGGPSGARTIDGIGTFERGAPRDVSDEVGAALVSMEGWDEVKTGAAPRLAPADQEGEQ